MTACSRLFIPSSSRYLVFCRSFCVRADCWVQQWFLEAPRPTK